MAKSLKTSEAEAHLCEEQTHTGQKLEHQQFPKEDTI
jgi:hypothetical protein